MRTIGLVLAFSIARVGDAAADELSLEQLTNQARVAAAQGYCQSAVRILDEIHALDPSQHELLLAEPALGACKAAAVAAVVEQPAVVAAPARRTQMRRYWWHVAMADTAIGYLAKLDEEHVVYSASALFLAAGPTVHLFHGNRRAALGSLALRGGAVALTFAVTRNATWDNLDETISYIILAGVTVYVVDWGLLAKKEVVVDTPVVPTIGLTRGGAMISLTGML